jgi:hypothetical protein
MRTLDTKTILSIQDLVANGHLTVDQALQLIKTLSK